MPPAPRPIAPSRRQQAPPPHPPSSLDLLFSYSRSAGFYGENIPSFVDRHRRPGHLDQSTDEEGAITGEGEGEGTTTDDHEGETDDDEHGWGHADEEGLLEGHWDERGRGGAGPTAFPGEQLPPNALPARRTSSTKPLHPSPLHPPPPATETTPLLRPPAPSPGPRVSSAPPSSTPSARRPSTFSKENWKARIEEHRGESSWGQTLFNTINVLIGVGLLADPLAMADSGWFCGVSLLLFCSFVTFYTALLLARLMRLHPSSQTYSDVLIHAYGPATRHFILFLFILELGTFSVAAVELFADSMASLYPKVGLVLFKVIAFAILLPTTFLPLRLLSLTSLLGILSSVVLLAVLITDGALKPDAPGSLRDVMPTSIGPRWGRFPLSFGLFMSGFSGHAVVPSLYRDMKNPRHFPSMAAVAFTVAFVVSLIFSVLGYLMFGNSVSPEVTRDLAAIPSYPQALTRLAVLMTALNPLVKYAIANKPLVQTFEGLVGGLVASSPAATAGEGERGEGVGNGGRSGFEESAVTFSSTAPSHSAVSSAAHPPSSITHHRPQSSSPPRPAALPAQSPWPRIRILRYTLLRPGLTLGTVLLAVLIPDFDRVLAFLGSASAFVICVILPVGAYLREGRKAAARARREEEEEDEGERLRISGKEKALCWVVLLVSVGLATAGTVWSFLPVEEAGTPEDLVGGR
ncbi:hypothetical protein JCM8097_005271 [Rhodosporidiobolus ruineniae]